MLVDESTLKPGLYRLPDDPVGPRVLIPGFRSSTSVRGAFGWFSAGWIRRLAPGLAEYLNRDVARPIEFTVAPRLFQEELRATETAQAISAEEAARRVAGVFVDGRVEASALARHALGCLTWMLAADRLRLRIAVPTLGSNYHPKLWLFDDGRHQVLARGSGNATGRGVSAGVEHLDVDVSWVEHSSSRVADGVRLLDDWSHARSSGIERVVDLPEALSRKIIELAPDAPPQQADYDAAAVEDGSPPWAVGRWERLRRHLGHGVEAVSPRRLRIPKELRWTTGRYAHQKDAVDAWEAGPEAERGTIAMATGAGKTLTALICATRSQDRVARGPFVVVISVPSIPLVLQWRSAIAKFGIKADTPTLSRNPDTALTNFFRRLDSEGTHVLVVTNNTLCSLNFRSTLALKCSGRETMFIADEAHRLGAEGFVSDKPEFFLRRLALSATPERQYDPDGTEEIFEFFGPPVYEFGLDRAIGFCLTPYDYYVHAATLDDDELSDFERLTARIGRALGAGRADDDDGLLRLAVARRKVIENARAKLPLLREVLERRGPSSLRQALIYVSAKNPQQFEDVGLMLTELGVRWAGVTQETTANRPALERTLATFRDDGYQVLLAKKVLDEGIDIPSTREAFIVASSTVEREWIQRRGRVLRTFPGKSFAVVHDFLSLPRGGVASNSGSAHVKRIAGTELGRAYSFARYARNAAGDSGVLAELGRIRSAFWPEDTGQGSTRQNVGGRRVASAMPEAPLW